MNDAKNDSTITRLGQSTKNAFHTLVRLLDAQRKAMSQAVRFMLRALLVGLMAIYAASIGHATIVPIPIDDDLSIYIPCTDVSGSTETGGVTVTATPGGQSAVSDASGNYKLLCLPIGTHTLTPTKPSTTFVPASRLVSVPTAEDIAIANISFNFGRTISGNVGIDGATITLMNGSLVVGTTTSDINGNYSFGSVGPGTFTVSVAKDHATFSPASQSVSVVIGGATNVSATFTLTSNIVPGATVGQFSVSAYGAASYMIPIQTPPGTAGIQPDLSLNYNSQSRNGLLGVGWSLGGLSVIHRCGANFTTDGASAVRGINYDFNDKYCLDGQRLILVPATGAYGAAGTEYRTEKESFTRIIAYGVAGNGPQYFIAYTKSGQVMTYGGTSDSRIQPIIAGVAVPTPRTWAISQFSDRFTNWMSFTYSQDTANGAYYPTDVYYTGNSTAGKDWNARIHFNYEGRPDTANQYVGAAKINFTQRLSGIDTYASATSLVKRYILTYGLGSVSARSQLTTIKECASDGINCLAATNASYTVGGAGITTTDTRVSTSQGTNWKWDYNSVQGDFNGDGKMDQIRLGGSSSFFCNSTAMIGGTPNPFVTCNLMTITGNYKAWASVVGDFDGDGISDVYLLNRSSNGAILCKGAVETTTLNCTSIPTGSFSGGDATRMYADDFDGDGRTDLFIIKDIYTSVGSTGGYVCLSPAILTTLSNLTGCTYLAVAQGKVTDAIVADLDGDQRAEILMSSQWIASSSPTTTYGYAKYRCTLTGGCQAITVPYGNWGGWGFKQDMLADYNSDGYVDMIIVPSFNIGPDWKFCPGPIQFPLINCQSMPKLSVAQGHPGSERLRISVGDFNGDQMNDLIIMDNVEGGPISAFFCKGPNFITAASACAVISVENWSLDIPYAGDYDGDGVTDLYFMRGDQAPNFATLTARSGLGPTDLLSSITTGLGENTLITYGNLASPTNYTPGTGSVAFPVVNFAPALPVVAKVNSSNGVGGYNERSITYQGARGHLQGRGFLGFEKIRTDEYVVPTNVLHRTESTFSQNVSNFACVGMTTKVEKSVNAGSSLAIYSKLTNNYSAFGTAGTSQHCYLNSSTQINLEAYETGTPQVTRFDTTNSAIDLYGNVGKIDVVSSDGYNKSIVNQYQNDTTNWLLGQLSCSAVTNIAPNTTSQTRTASFSYEGHGLLSQEIVEPGVTCGTAPAASTNAALRLVTDYGYDTYGNKISVIESSAVPTADPAYFAPRTTTTSYAATAVNPVPGQFPSSSTNASRNQSETYEYDRRFGGRTKLVGPNSLATAWTFDEFGRKKAELRADSTQTTWVYQPSISGNERYVTKVVSTGSPDSEIYYDMFNRELRQLVKSFAGTWISTTTGYDSFGRVFSKSRPHTNGAANATNFYYDLLGRLTSSSAVGLPTTTYAYNKDRLGNFKALTTTVMVANSTGDQKTSKSVNSQGWNIETVDAAASAVTLT